MSTATPNINAEKIQGNLSITSVSATTYYNLPVTSGSSVSGNYLPLSGGTVTGNTIFQSGLTATTISATTYQNLPSQSGTGISAFSYNQSTGLLTITKNDTTTLTAGTFSYVTATTLSSSNVLSVTSNGGSGVTTTINAVTGGTYSNGTITLSGTGTVNGRQITGLSTLTPTTLYTGNGALTSNRAVDLAGRTLSFVSSTYPNNFIINNGNVGVGKTPSYSLDVNGDINFPTTTGSTYGIIRQNGNGILHTYGTNNLFLGRTSGNFTMSGTGDNIGIGRTTLQNNTTGAYNIAIGGLSLQNNTLGNSNIAIGLLGLGKNTSGNTNIAIGVNTMNENTIGSDNVGVGVGALRNNISGNSNVAIGRNAGLNETGSNKLYIANNGSSPLIYGEFDNNKVGINTTSPTNALTVFATDPLKLEGVQTSTDTELLTIDGSGVVHKSPIPFLRNKTNSGATDTITINQSIFNPSNLTVLSASTFIVDTNADYYVLGDLYNSGTTIVNGTLKVGGIIYNSGTITGSGIIE